MVFEVGDTVKWMSPLDYDYIHGEILSITRNIATVRGFGVYKHITENVHLKYIQKVTGGKGDGICKRADKSRSIERKL